MNERDDRQRRKAFEKKVEAQERRMMRTRRDGPRSVWFGLGAFGMIGWSVAVPALAGALAGLWLDRNMGGPVPWTLILLILGLAGGCFNAWRWLRRQHDKISREGRRDLD